MIRPEGSSETVMCCFLRFGSLRRVAGLALRSAFTSASPWVLLVASISAITDIFEAENCTLLGYYTAGSFGTTYRSHLQGSSIICSVQNTGIARAEYDGTRAETRFRLSPKRTSPFKSVGASVQSTAGGRGVRISLSNDG